MASGLAPLVIDQDDAAQARRKASHAARDKRRAFEAKADLLQKYIGTNADETDGSAAQSPNSQVQRVEQLVMDAERKIGYTEQEQDELDDLSTEKKLDVLVFDAMFDDP
mmetsp:Transcript_42534/g.117729  ORF Transcript_42534/g.117729 Transcript_42534/m.117729 type:complete len:109 (+) Transcript_42534:36-362(+)|eukprot:776204-Prymnesium_polylepis.1